MTEPPNDAFEITVDMTKEMHYPGTSTATGAPQPVLPGTSTATGTPQPLLKDVATCLAAYALNLAHGARLEDFELTHLKELAAGLDVKVTDRHAAFARTRRIIDEIMEERRKQVEVYGYTPDRDASNPDRLKDEVLLRVVGTATPATRQQLVEAAAILVAEIEYVDRTFGSEGA